MSRRQAELALFAIAAVWGAAFVAIKLALQEISPLVFLGSRFLLAALLLAWAWRGLTRAELRAGALLGLFFWLGFVFQTVGLTRTTPSRAAFITAMSALLVPFIGWALDGTRPPRPVVVALLLAGAGSWLLTDPQGGGVNLGDVLVGGCAVVFAAQIYAATRLGAQHRPWSLAAVELGVTGLGSALVAPLVEVPRFVPTTTALIAFGLLVVIAPITFGGQLVAQARVPASRAALIFTVEPVVTAIASRLAFDERLTGLQMLGGALILGGTLVPVVWHGEGAGADAPAAA